MPVKTINSAVKVQHVLPGRVRYRLPGLNRHRALETPLLQMLETTAGVRQTRINPKYNSLVVRFDPQTLPPKTLTRSLEEFWKSRRAPVESGPIQVPVKGSASRQSELTTARRHFIGLSVVAGIPLYICATAALSNCGPT